VRVASVSPMTHGLLKGSARREAAIERIQTHLVNCPKAVYGQRVGSVPPGSGNRKSKLGLRRGYGSKR
jgi:hypothetical protein